MRGKVALVLAPLALYVACSDPPAPRDLADEEAEGPERRRRGADDGDEEGEETPGLPEPVNEDAGGGPGPGGSGAPILAHSASTLYRYDPGTNAVTRIGTLGCVPRDGTKDPGSVDNDSVIDLAVDSTGKVFGTTFWRFIEIDPTTGGCAVVKEAQSPNQYPNSLAFVSSGGSEVLVGYAFDNLGDATIFTRIDLVTGVVSVLGQLNPQPLIDGKEFGISGDVFSAGGKTYAAIKQLTGPPGTGNDLLAEIDPANGRITEIVGDTGKRDFYGIGLSGGKPYGFAETGGVFEIDLATGAATLKLDAKDEGATIVWYGAGAKPGP